MAKVIKKKWMPYYWPIPLAEEEIPMDKGGFRSVVIDMEKVISEFEDFVKSFSKRDDTYYKGLFVSVLALLKEQEEWLRKFQKDKDKLFLEVSEWKHKFHDRPEQDKENGHWIVLEYCANEGIYCSKCLNKIFDRSTKPKKKLSNYCPNCGSKNTHFFNPSTDKIMYSD